eukprot:1143560-Pelagomonas_calceolata.AAC.4
MHFVLRFHLQPDDNRFDRNFAEPPAWEARRSILGDDSTSTKGAGRGRRPHELDLRVPKDKQIIAITGMVVEAPLPRFWSIRSSYTWNLCMQDLAATMSRAVYRAFHSSALARTP